MSWIDIDFHCLPFVPHIRTHMYIICLIVATRSRQRWVYGMIWTNLFNEHCTLTGNLFQLTNRSKHGKNRRYSRYINCKISSQKPPKLITLWFQYFLIYLFQWLGNKYKKMHYEQALWTKVIERNNMNKL